MLESAKDKEFYLPPDHGDCLWSQRPHVLYLVQSETRGPLALPSPWVGVCLGGEEGAGTVGVAERPAVVPGLGSVCC